jgi:hypothetical protein
MVLLVFFVLLLMSLVLRVVTTPGLTYRTVRPAAALNLPYVTIQVVARDNGVHLVALRHREFTFEFKLDHVIRLDNTNYVHARAVRLLGLTVAILPRTFDGVDYIVSPYAAIALPYWFLIGVSSLALVALTGLGGIIRPYCRFSKTACAVMALIAMVFIAANFVPRNESGTSAEGTPGERWRQLYRLCFDPSSYSEISLAYGFPFVCYRRAWIEGKSVGIFYGDDTLGWRPHLLMENVCLALLAMAAAGAGVEWIRVWSRRRVPIE